MFRFSPLWVAILVAWTPQIAHGEPANLRGSLGIHDPSAVITCNGRYYVFGTGQGIISKSSADKSYWITGPSIFNNPPAWTTNAVPGFTGFFWAPDITFFNGLYHLYYAVSTFGSQTSAIGLATSPTLDPSSPSYQWTDHGAVIQSGSSVNFNAIDPSVTFDPIGNLWMSFGSYWTGIKLIQLDPASGMRSSTNSTVYPLAYNSSIEASYLYHHGSYFYLFVNWGTCCSGVDSTYNIRVGRSINVTGPYLDQNGNDMMASNGKPFLKTTGRYIGPGQIGILDENGTNWFGYHYYDADINGAPTFDLEPLSWTADEWPVFTNDWQSTYRFHMDARDDNDEYYGLLQNGASIRNDSQLGDTLVLNGTNQYGTFPGGLGNAQTFIAVFKWNGGAAWQRVFDFGRGTNSYAFLTPQGANGHLRFAISSSGPGGEQLLDAGSATPVGSWTQVAVTTDGSRGILYINGAPVTTNAAMTLTAPDIAPTNVWMGRSQFPGDPYFNGQISSIQIFGRALSAGEIGAPPSLPGTSNALWTASYPFDNGAADSGGVFNGVLVGGATTATDSVRGSVLNLSGASAYVDLPSGIGGMRTFSAWVNWAGGNAWQRIFDFGKNSSSYAMLTARANTGALRFEITANGSAEARQLDAPSPLPTNVWTHVAVTLDGRQAVMFVNGRAVAVNSSVNLLPSDVLGPADYFGRSQFPADPYFRGQMDSITISSATLPIEQITASVFGYSRSPSGLTLNWPGWTNGLELFSVSGLGSGTAWKAVPYQPVLMNGINFVTVPSSSPSTFFRLQIPEWNQ